MEVMKNDIGKRIRIIRKKLDLTQEQLASYLGVTGSAVSSYELGDVLPSVETVIKLVEYGNVSYNWLIAGRESIEGEWKEQTILTHDEAHLLEEYRKTAAEHRKMIIHVAEIAARASLIK